jgi:hypothetical protein
VARARLVSEGVRILFWRLSGALKLHRPHEWGKENELKDGLHVGGPGGKVHQRAMHPRASNCHYDQTGMLEDLLCRERVRDQRVYLH